MLEGLRMRCGEGQDYHMVWDGLRKHVFKNEEYIKACKGHHRGEMGDWASLGDAGVYYPWDLGTAYIKGNYVSRFWGEFFMLFFLVSDIHRITALEESHKFRERYKLVMHIRHLLTEGTLEIHIYTYIHTPHTATCI